MVPFSPASHTASKMAADGLTFEDYSSAIIKGVQGVSQLFGVEGKPESKCDASTCGLLRKDKGPA